MRRFQAMIRSISKPALCVGVAVFFLLGSLGLGHSYMTMGPDGQVASGNCFMPGMAETLCQMNPLEHVGAWQMMFVAVPSQSSIFSLLSVLLALALSAALVYSNRSTAPSETSLSRTSFSYKKQVPIASPLQEAFSSGILHPKIF